jgi:hypothetical protein
MTSADPFGWLAKDGADRASELQGKLADITGKRRSSPAAKAMQTELDGLKDQAMAAQDEALTRSTQTEQDLRKQIVDLQSERGQLGPKVNAATARAEAEAQAMGLKPVDATAPVSAAAPEIDAALDAPRLAQGERVAPFDDLGDVLLPLTSSPAVSVRRRPAAMPPGRRSASLRARRAPKRVSRPFSRAMRPRRGARSPTSSPSILL